MYSFLFSERRYRTSLTTMRISHYHFLIVPSLKATPKKLFQRHLKYTSASAAPGAFYCYLPQSSARVLPLGQATPKTKNKYRLLAVSSPTSRTPYLESALSGQNSNDSKTGRSLSSKSSNSSKSSMNIKRSKSTKITEPIILPSTEPIWSSQPSSQPSRSSGPSHQPSDELHGYCSFYGTIQELSTFVSTE